MASLMWNHAPRMWAEMKQQGVTKPSLIAARRRPTCSRISFRRGISKSPEMRRAASRRSRPSTAPIATASPPLRWRPRLRWPSGIRSPTRWCWRSRCGITARKCARSSPRRRSAGSSLTAQELTDMLVYLQNLPETRSLAANFSFPPTDSGREAVPVQGLRRMPHGKTGAREPPAQPDPDGDRGGHVEPPAKYEESAARACRRRRCGRSSPTSGRGSISSGRATSSAARKCTTRRTARRATNRGPAPKLARGKDGHSQITMVSALWDHGPQMLELMNEKKLAWPHFTAQQMSDLIAYLNSLN